MNLYLASNSPSTNCGDAGENFCYQNNNNNNNVHLNKNLHESIHKNYSEVNSRENSPRENYRLDSPDKRGDTCSPEESSRSYSSQKNDDVGSRSPIHNHNNDSLGSQSPENLSSKSQQQNNNHKLTEMLDHKLQLSFLGPPLAALHSMTEMKSQNSPQTSQHSQGPSNPHGIDSILSRPTPVTSAQLNALGGAFKTLNNLSLSALNHWRLFNRQEEKEIQKYFVTINKIWECILSVSGVFIKHYNKKVSYKF